MYHRYTQVLHYLTMGADRILKCTADTFLGQTDRYLVPEDKKLEVFRMVHEIPSAGHFGIHATAALALRHFWYPGLNADIRNRIKSCVVCIQKDINVRTTAGAYMPGTNGFPGQTLYVDLVQMAVSSEGYHYILSMEDGFSRFISLAPLRSKVSEEVIQALLERYISRFGCPLVIHSDNGKEFTNQLEVAHTTTPAYNPQSNNVEKFHRTLREHYRMWTGRKKLDWAKQLPCLELAYNSKVNEATGLTPFLVFMGREAKLPADMILPNQQEDFQYQGEAVEHCLKNMDKIYDYLKGKEEIRIR